MSTVTWLHISDLHMKSSGVAVLDLDRTARDVAEQMIRRGIVKLDFIVIAGDLAWSGKPDEYRRIERELSCFIENINRVRDQRIERSQIFVVPGNHDVDRQISPDDLSPKDTDADVSATLMQSHAWVLKRQYGYASFIERFFQNANVPYNLAPLGLYHVRNFVVGGHSISILCLNSAWLSKDDSDRGKLALGEPQVHEALDEATGGLLICLMHHPFSWLREHEEPVIHRSLARKCAFILTGHQHTTRFGEAPFWDGALLLSAGAVHLPNRLLSYNIVSLDLGSGYGAIYMRSFTGQSPDWSDYEPSPNVMSEGQLQLKREAQNMWRPVFPGESEVLGMDHQKAPEFCYSNLYRVASYTIPYIVLNNSWQWGTNDYRWGEIQIQTANKAFRLPEAFEVNRDRYRDMGYSKCRLLRYETKITPYYNSPNTLVFTLSQVRYIDYLMSGEHLDDPLPGDPDRTFRDVYAPRIDSTHEFDEFPLTNICGVGIFLITRDNKIILSRHSLDVDVYGDVWSYSASGTMDWSGYPHPFSEVTRECFEEINHHVNPDNLRLFSLGIDAKKLYFQFSFFERTARSSEDILQQAIFARDYSAEMEKLESIPFECDVVVNCVKGRNWEPAAAAGLLTLCAKQFGIDKVKKVVDPEFARLQWRDEITAEWRQRAARPGDMAVMSARYPYERCPEESKRYTDAVLAFIGEDIDEKDVLEVGAGTGRITERLIQRVGKLTCIDLSQEMLDRNQERLRRNLGSSLSEKVIYQKIFLQDYYPPRGRHDIAISSLVLIHNVDDDAFQKAVERICSFASTIFLFEHADIKSITSSQTYLRSEEELRKVFGEYHFQVERSDKYMLFSDRIAFLKLVQGAC